jgi:hypothetical protein
MKTLFYPSRHLAENALCRLFDRGVISFETWLSNPVKQARNGYVIVLNSNDKGE